jgi:hypothetical protein
MPMNIKLYPENWKKVISPECRARAGNKCEWCGKPNGQVVKVGTKGIWQNPETGEWWKPATYKVVSGQLTLMEIGMQVPAPPKPWRNLKVVLTVAHLGVSLPDGSPGDKTNKMDCRPENLAALCQYCHLLFDVDEHQARARNAGFRGRGAGGKGRGGLDVVAAIAGATGGHFCTCKDCGRVYYPTALPGQG